MISGQKNKSKNDYFGIELDSSSSIRKFAKDRRKYYKKYILGEDDDEEEQDDKAAIMGSLVHCRLLEPENFDNQFYLSTCSEVPTGQMLTFVNAVYNHYKIYIEDEQELGENVMEEVMKKAFLDVGSKKYKLEWFVNNFVDKQPEMYFRELIMSKQSKKTIVTSSLVDLADRIISELKSCEYTSEIVNLTTGGDYEVHNEIEILSFFINGLEMKAKLDKVIVNHKEKWVKPFDVKCVWSVEHFMSNYFIGKLGYLQAGIYDIASGQWAQYVANLEGYAILPISYIVCDSSNYYLPLIYHTDDDILRKCFHGFIHNEREYKGLNRVIEDLKWAKATGNWRVSRLNDENKGNINLSECTV